MPDVVPGLVLAEVEEVHARAAKDRAVVPLQDAVEAPDHLPLEPVQELLRRRGADGAGGVRGSASRSGASAGHALAERELGNRDGREDAVDHGVGADPVAECLVREHEAVAEDVVRDLLEVLRQRVLPSADERQRAAARGSC